MARISVISEDVFRRMVVDKAQMYHYHVSHVESHQTSAGVPDLNIAKGVDMWLELKVVKKTGITLRPTQKKWHRDRHAAGGKSWVAVLTGSNDILLLPGHVAADLTPRDERWETSSNTFKLAHLDSLIFALHHEAFK